MEVESLGVTEALELPELRRNSTICVTIDDVAEGLLVVSFSHDDNLYQGILFQLNRERGIPSGISFPKEPPLGTSPKAEDVLVAVPLHQRHSYNSGLNGPYYTQVSQPSLRRIIKPPARFKNARMSLRLRARPVLCAKCRTLCDEKSDSGSDLPKEDNGKGQTEKKKDRPKPKNENVAGYLNGTHNGNEQTSSSTTSIATDPQDLNYESVGSTRVVENYWKRPLVKPLIPLTEETYSKLRKQKGNIAPKNKRKRATTLPFIADTKTDSISTENEAVPGNEDLPPLLPPCDIIPNTRQRLKRLSLTKCITKLTEMRTEACAKRTRRSVGEDKPPKLDLIDSSSEDHHRSTGESLTAPVSEQERISIRPKRKSSGYGRKGSQSWGSRIRTKSNVPLRYREEGYLTKNIFNFNKRQSPTQASELPVLTICRNENANSFTVSKAPDLPDENGAEVKLEKNEIDHISEGTSDLPSLLPKEDVTPVESVDLIEPGNIKMKPTFAKPPEVTKTPTIKITFGTSGNGMVVQIPPKLTQNAECDSTDLKAVRKALKRAKKEAKRKRSISPAVPSSDALSPVEPSVKMETLEEMTTPISDDLKTEVCPDPIQMENGSLEMTPPELQLHEEESEQFPRKKKKQKKHRRSSKLLKENEREVNFPSQDLNESNSSSSSSSLTQDNLPQESCASQKEVTMKNFDSVSSPATPEPPPKDTCPLRLRRKSVPATLSPSVDLPKRVCINLKRIDANEYVPLPSRSNTPDEEEKVLENNGNNGVDTEDHSDECLPADGHSDEGVMRAFTESVECYEDKETGCIYHKGDIIWGKLPACPWWPGKITDILLCGSEEVRAIISWFKSPTQSSIRITMILPFIEYYDSKYSRNRRRGSYQLAVNAAKLEVLNSASHNEPTQPNRDLN